MFYHIRVVELLCIQEKQIIDEIKKLYLNCKYLVKRYMVVRIL